MTKAQPVKVVVRPVFDPAVPESVVRAVAGLVEETPELLATGADATVTNVEGGRVLRTSIEAVLGGAGVGATAWMTKWLIGEPTAYPDTDLGHREEQVATLIRSALDLFQNGGAMIAAAGVVCAAALLGYRVSDSRRMARALDQARGHYIHPSWLTSDAAPLLARAQQAESTVLHSQLHIQDMEGLGTANRTQMPDQIWSIAQSLHRYSRATASARMDGSDETPTSKEFLAGELAILEAARSDVEHQVVALEAYARQAQEVDRIAASRQAMERLEMRGEALMGLAAETAASELAVGEIKALTERASAAALSLTEALATARDAATAALPPSR
ncbi:hypothetical protein [Streptomyces sp. TLI_171]|uniref:hypothetical protein n=1 Tax=Streptomyces sp. TLI_171 TaxID=1938859 RepID=UPI000C17CFFD|nr:hypothetical protein [Streptomyces sp. TLI_171]RKE02922.1 hypothetical protein BX266_7525 [Streptomyces sp. TLI_171]